MGVFLLWLFSLFIVKPFVIPSESMQPVLNPSDRILVNRTAYWSTPISRGDVVVFDGADSFGVDPGDFVKRVVGIEGDRVVCCTDSGQLSINGVPIDESAYLYSEDQPSQTEFDVLVPEGKLWLLGDHRSQSADSRSHLGDPGGGFVLESKVVGQAEFIIWPPARWQSLDSHLFKEMVD